MGKFWKIVKAVTLVVPALEGIYRAAREIFRGSSMPEDQDRTGGKQA